MSQNTYENMILTDAQQTALKLMKQGYNVFLTGPAGTGKSTVISIFKSQYMNKIAITSTTGVSALLIKGTTIHSFAGIGTGEESVQTLLQKIKRMPFLVKRWKNIDCLIIDEVSMMKPELLEKLDTIAKTLRSTLLPFGGIQLILTGDFAQLPPVYLDNKPKFCFESIIWPVLVEKTVHLTEIIRQTDKQFRECLLEIRLGDVSQESIDIIKTRLLEDGFRSVPVKNGIIPTRLFSRRRDVQLINNKCVAKLKDKGNKVQNYIATVKGVNEAVKDKINKSCPAPTELELVVGAQVMLVFNVNVGEGLVNGSRGVVVALDELGPTVRFLDGRELLIGSITWEFMENDKVVATKSQIPFIVAYACTIHKTQGATLDYAVIDAGPTVFQCGQIYTALSRVRSLDGLFLLKFDPEKIACNPKVKEFYQKINVP